MKTVRFTKRTADGSYGPGDVALLEDNVADRHAEDGYGVIAAEGLTQEELRAGAYGIDGETGERIPLRRESRREGLDHTRVVDEDAVKSDAIIAERERTEEVSKGGPDRTTRTVGHRVVKG